MAELPVVYGARYSVYVQALRACLEEKGVAYRVEEVDVFAPAGPPPEHLLRHPFGRIPAFRHGDLLLYETAPTCRYIDEAFDGPRLQPASAEARARMGQAISITDSYGYRSMVWGLYVETVEGPARGRAADPSRVNAATDLARTSLMALDRLSPGTRWMAGADFSLADLHLAPMFALFVRSPAAADLMRVVPRLGDWFEQVQDRPAVRNVLLSGQAHQETKAPPCPAKDVP